MLDVRGTRCLGAVAAASDDATRSEGVCARWAPWAWPQWAATTWHDGKGRRGEERQAWYAERQARAHRWSYLPSKRWFRNSNASAWRGHDASYSTARHPRRKIGCSSEVSAALNGAMQRARFTEGW